MRDGACALGAGVGLIAIAAVVGWVRELGYEALGRALTGPVLAAIGGTALAVALSRRLPLRYVFALQLVVAALVWGNLSRQDRARAAAGASLERSSGQ